MNQQQKDQWLAALRAGQYRQGKGVLKSFDDRYCCLGVAAEVCGIKSISFGYIRQLQPNTYREHAVFLPQDIQAHLAGMNDDGKTFPEIADYIEKFVPADDSK